MRHLLPIALWVTHYAPVEDLEETHAFHEIEGEGIRTHPKEGRISANPRIQHMSKPRRASSDITRWAENLSTRVSEIFILSGNGSEDQW